MAGNLDEATLTGLEKQVDALVKQIDDVLKAGKGSTAGPDSDDADVTGSGKDNLGDWKRKEGKHTHQVKKGAEEGDPEELEKALGSAAETLGIEKADLALALMALEKAKKKSSEDDSEDGEDDGDEDDMDSNPTKKAAPEDETFEWDGETISKAAVGEAVFGVLKKQSEKIEAANKDIAKAKEEAEMERLQKRADAEYSHVPGSTDERAKMLKAIAGMPKDLQKSFGQVFAQSEKLAKSAFEGLGFGGKDPEDMQKTRRDFEVKVSEIAKRDGCSRTEALQKARHEDPEGFKAYQGH